MLFWGENLKDMSSNLNRTTQQRRRCMEHNVQPGKSVNTVGPAAEDGSDSTVLLFTPKEEGWMCNTVICLCLTSSPSCDGFETRSSLVGR